MKKIICYKSKHGATQKYMEWLAEETKADLKTFEEIGRKFDFADYDLIVVSSGTYAGLMPLTRFLKKNWKKIEGKKVFVVAVGAAPIDDKWSLWSYNRIPEKIRQKIEYTKLMGEAPENARPKDYVSQVKKENIKELTAKINKA